MKTQLLPLSDNILSFIQFEAMCISRGWSKLHTFRWDEPYYSKTPKHMLRKHTKTVLINVRYPETADSHQCINMYTNSGASEGHHRYTGHWVLAYAYSSACAQYPYFTKMSHFPLPVLHTNEKKKEFHDRIQILQLTKKGKTGLH